MRRFERSVQYMALDAEGDVSQLRIPEFFRHGQRMTLG